MRADPVRVWYIRAAGSALGETVTWTVAPVWFVTQVHMSPLQLVLVGTCMELAIFVFEIPTGIVADLVSRRLSVVIGHLVMGAAIVFSAAIPQAWAVMVAWALWGFGYTFTSGAADAWLADEIGVDNVRPVYLHSAQLARAVAFFAIGISIALALVSFRLPILVGGVVIFLVGMVLAVTMPERHFRPVRHEGVEGSARTFLATGRAGVRLIHATPILLLIVAITFFWGAWSEAYDRLGDAHLIRDVGLPSFAGLSFVIWFGVISAASLVLAFAVAHPVNRRLEHAPRRLVTRVLLFSNAALVVTVAVFGLANAFWIALVAMLATNTVRSLVMPLYTSWLNQSIGDSSVRATVLSIVSQADAVGEWAGGPAMGAIGNVYGIRAALVTGAALLTPAVALYARALRKRPPEAIVQAAA